MEEPLARILDRLAARRNIGHAVLAVERGDGSFRWIGARGEARPNGPAMRADTPFFIASIDKLFNAAIVLTLYERGSVKLTEPTVAYLPASLTSGLHRLGGIDYTNRITVQHLLSHTSGLPDWLEDYPKGGRSLVEQVLVEGDREVGMDEIAAHVRERLTPHFAPQPLDAPRPKARYSDTNFTLLAWIIEAVTGRALHDVHDEMLFRPLGLRRTWMAGRSRPLDPTPEPAALWAGLAPFHYYGVPDHVDYTNIPWRSTRFDEDALTAAVATQRRAENALEQLRTKGGGRALGFCVSQRHADFMAAYFNQRGIRAAAVHSGHTSAPRAASLERLEAGELDIVFAVDMFNEGVDLPTLDTVMMLRPTESKILWLQQFGRGLRKAAGKERLPQTLFGLRSGDREIFNLLERLRNGTQELPPGCEVTYELEAVEILEKLLRRSTRQIDALERHYLDFKALHGVRPTATEVYEDGFNPRAVRERAGSWLRFVGTMGDLDATQQRALERHGAFIDTLDTTEMVRSYKMLVLLAMLNANKFPGSVGISELADHVEQLVTRTATAAADLGSALNDRKALIRLLEQNPLAAWAGGRGTAGVSYFSYRDRVFQTTFAVEPDSVAALQEMVRELAEWRLIEYLDRARTQTASFSTLRVSHASGRPVLFLPTEPERSDLPEGWTDVLVDGTTYSANFAKVAIDVLRKGGDEDNQLPRVLRQWFGPDAGAPGTRHQVALELKDEQWRLTPIGGRRRGELQLWRNYSREEIPGLFGFEFSTAIWNAGFVKRPGHIFLLVTLDKAGHGSEFQYKDHFVSRTEFEWQSQNRTSRQSVDGQDIRHHAERGLAVHLFVRNRKKRPRGGAAPFLYCGDVRFMEWHGDRPITVRWKLPVELPDAVWAAFNDSSSG